MVPLEGRLGCEIKQLTPTDRVLDIFLERKVRTELCCGGGACARHFRPRPSRTSSFRASRDGAGERTLWLEKRLSELPWQVANGQSKRTNLSPSAIALFR